MQLSIVWLSKQGMRLSHEMQKSSLSWLLRNEFYFRFTGLARWILAAENVEHGHVPRSRNVHVTDSGIAMFTHYKITSQVLTPVSRSCSLEGTWLPSAGYEVAPS